MVLQNLPEFSTFKQSFGVDEKMMKEFLKIAEAEGVAFNEQQFDSSEAFIRYQVKALIARNLWGMTQYYEVISEADDTLLKALEIIKSEKMFSEAFKPSR